MCLSDKPEGLICVCVEVVAHQSQLEDMQVIDVHTGEAGVSCLSVAAVRPGRHHRIAPFHYGRWYGDQNTSLWPIHLAIPAQLGRPP